MSKRIEGMTNRKRKTVLALIGAYLLSVVGGCFIIWAIPFFRNKTVLLELSTEKGNEVLSAGRISEVPIFGMEYMLFSEEGTHIFSKQAFLHPSQWEEIRSYVPRIMEEGSMFDPSFLLVDNHEDPRYVFGIVVGTVVEGQNGHRFASILLRDFSDLDSIMVTYVVLFSIMYVVGVLFSLHILRQERDLNQMRRDLVANVSHELKTPITAIRAMAEVLHDGMAKDEASRRSYSGRIIEESDRLEQLVQDILELSRLQSKRTEFKKRTVYADGIIPPVIDRYMMLCGDMGITLDTSGLNLTDAPAMYTDPDKLVSLMNILLDNAVKFTEKGGCIWVSNQFHGKSITFCIRDNGPGIRSEDLDRIFDRFYKADVAHNSRGSGLGLSIADEIAKGLGEKLWVESTYGIGSAFYFTVGH